MPEYRLSVGNVEVLCLTDAETDLPVPLGEIFPDVPADAWGPFQERYPEVFRGPDTYHLHFDSYLLRSQGRTILVDTGIGNSETNPEISALTGGVSDGQLMAELQAAGMSPEDIDTVFMTHLHPDHVGWNLSPGGDARKLTFPNARYVAHQVDWDSFKKPEIHGEFPFNYWEETLAPLEGLGAIDLLPGETALTDEVTAIHTPGHTLGHMSVVIASGGQYAVIVGDAAIHPAQVTEADWAALVEMDKPAAAQSRRKLFELVEAENGVLIACHFPAPGYGKLVRVEGRRYWQGL
jgi:glyoxylase-like metal-dependent hydrolase (beta-lactamase superfamily II)